MNTDNPNEFNKEDWLNSLKENPQVQEFFSRYRKSSIDDFCEGYLSFRQASIKHGDAYIQHNDRRESEGIDMAMEHLAIIQQKKLFDMQCLWRANQIDLLGIRVCFQFTAWAYIVLDCPFLEPVTEQDIRWYQEFLSQQEEIPENGFMSGWQDYEDFKNNYVDDDTGQELPAWYDFHNMKTGNGILLTYPDVRGEQEKYYFGLRREKKQQVKAAKKIVPNPEQEAEDAKPFLSRYDHKAILELAGCIEDKKSLRWMQAYHAGTENLYTWEQERAHEAFDYLSQIKGELVPIEGHRDFREAIRLAAERYKINKIINHLPAAHRKYLLMRENGIDLSSERDHESYQGFQDLVQMHLEALEEGQKISRETKGEVFD